VERVVSGDEQARDSLWIAIEPTLKAISGKWSIVGRLSERDDERTNIELKIMDALLGRDCRRLRLFLDAHDAGRAGTFRTWLVAVARNLAIDYVRGHPEYSSVGDRGPGRWVQHDPLPVDDQMPVSATDPAARIAASRMLEYARTELSADQIAALLHWLQGADDDEIAAELAVTPKKGHQLVRAALERLRRRFRNDEGHTDSRKVRP
jgi:DNA-directed RNA polymerase specialized sigma24 family protein